MKKTVKSIFSAVMAAAMLLTAIPFAASALESTMTVPTMYYGTEAPANYTYSYDNTSVLSDSYQYGLIIPMKLTQAGTVRFRFSFPRLEKSMTFNVYTDMDCTNSLYATSYFSVGDTTGEKYVSVSSAGTYYIKLYSSVYSTDNNFANTVTMSVCEYTVSDKTIKSGQTISYYRKNGSDKYYFKYAPAKTGKVKVTLPYTYGSYLTLTNASKKAVSDQEWVSSGTNSNEFTFAVKKGKTYYFLVTSNGVSGGNLQSISIKETAIKEKSGAKKSKAVNIKSGKKVNGLVAAGENKADWYKFKLKKNKKLKIDVTGNVSGTLKVIVYYKGKKNYTYSFTGGSAQIKTLYGKSKKGTYQIKVVRSNSLSSGTYTLKWK